MMKIQILGPGCYNCQLLAAKVEAAADELGLEYELEKVTDLNQITAMGVLMTPGLVIDGEVKVSGRVPSPSQIKQLLQSHP
ncbi:MAG: thioredoxin family protein [Thermoanaerobaculia bacterium]|jgi:small redox-active disulfide protein 2